MTIPGSSLIGQQEHGVPAFRRNVQFSARGSVLPRENKSPTPKPASSSVSRPSPVRSKPTLAVLWVGYALLNPYVIASQAANLNRMIATNFVADIIEAHAGEEGRDK